MDKIDSEQHTSICSVEVLRNSIILPTPWTIPSNCRDEAGSSEPGLEEISFEPKWANQTYPNIPKLRAKNIEVVLGWSFFGADGRHTRWQALFFHLSSWGSSKLTSSSSNINMRRHGKSSSEDCLSNQSLKHCLSIRASFPGWNHVYWWFLHSFLIQLYTFSI